MLNINNLQASIDDKTIINKLNLSIPTGEIHAIMGPNGSGKSTLANLLAGHKDYQVTHGSIDFDGKDLLAMAPEIRAREGLFLAFQYPTEIPGVTNIYFLKASLNTIRKHRGEPEIDAFDFTTLVKAACKKLKMSEDFLYRPVNTGFSGGEKKRNAILQMMLLQPKIAILDEADSGLDIDALKLIAENVNDLRSPDRSFLLITHYQRLLDYIVPDTIHVMLNGKIIESGGPELAKILEEKGYQHFQDGAAA